MKPVKAMTIRLAADQAAALETVANVENQPVSEVIRAAISAHITEKQHDDAFRENLKDHIAQAQFLLETRDD